jgi:RNA polymerase sigma factor (sigma-70 family)
MGSERSDPGPIAGLTGVGLNSAGLTGTSRRIRGAIDGDASDLAWTVERLSPVLLQQARYRMRGRLQRVCDPEDVVAHAWQVSLPRLGGLIARDGRFTPVLLKFLSTAVLLRINELLRQQARRGAAVDDGGGAAATHSSAPGSVGALPAPGPGVPTAVVRSEALRIVLATIDELEPIDREVIVLRLVEQRSSAEVAGLLGIETGTVNVRLHRALGRLRQRLPDSVFGDLSAECAAE